ncbi:calcium ion channel [Aureococcus anophagefferens]|nr:calcium ion channel [Aureococcus anophagefferens]
MDGPGGDGRFSEQRSSSPAPLPEGFSEEPTLDSARLPRLSVSFDAASALEDEKEGAPAGDATPASNLGRHRGGDPRPPVVRRRHVPTFLDASRAPGAEERAAASDLDDVAELACCCVGRDSAVRLWCLRTVRHPLFDRAVLVLILVNSLIMAAQDPREAETALTTVSEIVFNVAFTCEMALKMVATGVASGESAYFRDPWNRFDFVTVVCGWLPLAIETAYCAASLDGSCFAVEEGGGPNLTFLRVVRVVMEVLLFIFFVFGAIGVQLFMGKLRQHCFDEASETLACRDRDYDGRPNDRDTTLNRYISFDNILLGFATVLTTVSLEGWSSTLYALMDALGPAVVVYFVLLVLVGAFFVVNLIVAVIYQAYVTEEAGAETAAIHETKAHFVLEPPEDAGGADSIDAHAWRKRPPSASLALNLYDVLLPDRSEDLAAYGPATAARRRATAAWWRLRDVCCYVATTTAFSHFIMLCIVFNTIILMAEYEGQSDAHRRFNCAANDWLTWIFVWEMVVKMLGTAYVFDEADGRFNLFDCVITLGSIADLVVAHATGGGDCRRGGGDADDDDQDSSSGTFQVLKIGRVLRLVRIFRSLRMVRNWKSMAHILSAVLRSGPGLVNFSCLLMMFSWNWDTVLDYAFRANGYVGLLFIVSMYLVGNFIVLNIFLAILLSNFEMAVDSTNATLYDELEQSNEILVLLKTVAHWAKRLLITAQLRAANSSSASASSAPLAAAGPARALAGRAPRAPARRRRRGRVRPRHGRGPGLLRARAIGGAPALASAQKSARSLELGVEHLLEATGILGHDDDHWERTVDERLEDIVEQMQEELPTGTHHRGRREYHDCFPGSVAVDWALESGTARTVSDATDLGQKLLDERLIAPTDVDVTSKFQRMLADLKNSPSARANRAYATSASAGDGGASPLKTPSQAQRLEHAVRVDAAGARAPGGRGDAHASSAPRSRRRRAAQAAMTFRDNHQLYRFCARHMHRLNIVGDPELLASRRATQSVRDAAPARTLRRSLGVLSRRNALRKRAVDVVTHPSFDMLVGVLIVVSSGVLAASDPDGGGSRGKRDALAAADVALTACFCVELLLKVVAQGLVPYLASGWNVLDAFIVAVSVGRCRSAARTWATSSAASARALRPLRMIQRYPAMKTVVDALMEAVPDVVNVAFVVVGFFCIFAVAGGTLFRAFKWCHVSRKSRSDCRRWDIACDYDVTGGDLNTRSTSRYFATASARTTGAPVVRGRGLPWSRFDADKLEGTGTRARRCSRSGGARSPLRQPGRGARAPVATLEGWPALMYAAMDVTEDRHAHPQRNATPAHALFYVIFMAKERTDGASIFLTEQQRGFVDRVKVLLDAGRPKRLRVPRCDRGGPSYAVVSEGFELAVIAAIVLNMGAISLNHYDQAKAWDDADLGLNLFFTVVFLLELVLKWVGLGPRQYFADPWNRFDAFIVLTSLVDNASEFMATFYHIPLLNAMNLSLFRIFRLARRQLVNVNPGLKTLLQSLIVSLPSLFNVGSLLVLLIFVYAASAPTSTTTWRCRG